MHAFGSSFVTRCNERGGVSHGSLLAEPLLAGPAVLDVLQHVAQQRPLPPLVLTDPLHALVHLGTWRGSDTEVNTGTPGKKRPG